MSAPKEAEACSVTAVSALRAPASPQTRMLAKMLGAAGVDLEELLEAARIAGLTQPSSMNTNEAAAAPWRGHGILADPAVVHHRGEQPPTVRRFYEETVAPIARAASGTEPRGGGTFRTYESYWKVMVYGYPYQRLGSVTRDGLRVGADPVPPEERLYSGLGDMLVTDVRYRDLNELVGWCKVRAQLAAHRSEVFRERRGRHVRHGDQSGAERNAVGAVRFFFKHAVLDDLLPPDRNISMLLPKPRKKHSSRRALTPTEYAEVWAAIVGGGNDPELDSLIAETVLVTGARREGLINLNLSHLDDIRVTITLDEKNGRIDEQPATRDLIARLRRFAESRGSTTGTDPVFCYLDSIRLGRPHRLTSRRLDYLHERIQTALPWADRMGFSVHVLRHHSITTVERISSEAVAARFARHTPDTVTRDYDKASGEEVCAAVAAMTGTIHPLATGGW